MVRAAALAIIALLSGCNQKSVDGSEVQAVADHYTIVGMQAKIDRQDAEIDRLGNSVGAALNLSLETSASLQSLRQTFNRNVDASNESLRRQRTAAGICGQEQVFAKDGTYTIRNKDCPPK